MKITLKSTLDRIKWRWHVWTTPAARRAIKAMDKLTPAQRKALLEKIKALDGSSEDKTT